ncbi:MAG TPA: SAM-dependent methyltransferase, partial [Prochlorococcaceae cyanobacterium Fu_MAG_134]|nr:SAM-dependent methyltransferase [Prochlorococcaceae cyanobacterium Fu_MAG_134]
KVHYADRSDQPWRVVEGIEFRSVTLVGQLPDF